MQKKAPKDCTRKVQKALQIEMAELEMVCEWFAEVM